MNSHNEKIDPRIGYWMVLNHATQQYTRFHNKIEALVYLSGIDGKIVYKYFDDTWLTFDRSHLGKIPLTELYRLRAQQLRDSYDYLILYYSGGSDSHNILHTFIKNNIKLDHIFVRWPMQANRLHQVNSTDRSAYNFMSEWELVIEKDLKWLASTHPEIKIEVADWTGKITTDYFNEDRFSTLQHFHSAANLTRMQTFSETEVKLVDSGKKVAEIWGIDKPLLSATPDGNVYMEFNDISMAIGTPYYGNVDGTEVFYWSPNFPELAFEQAYQLFQYYDRNPQLRPIIQPDWDTITVEQRHENYQLANNISKFVLYPDWNPNRFQADKPKSGYRVDKDYWLYSHPEFKDAVASWKHLFMSELDLIKPEYCQFDIAGHKTGLWVVGSRHYKIGQFKNNTGVL